MSISGSCGCRAIILMALGTTVLVAGCGNDAGMSHAVSTSNSAIDGTELPVKPSPAETALKPEADSDPLQVSFAEVSSSILGDVGVAIADADGVRTFGNWQEGPAWSTIKVPLAIAGLRHSRDAAASLVPLMIKDSDNDAAEKVWAQLGDPKQAAEAVQAVLRDGGDPHTAVQSERVRPEFTAFGQTVWPAKDQARFAANIPCLEASKAVLDDMHHLAVNQQWGLALREDAAAKGGWGPSENGHYLVRQLALITTPTGTLGFALTAAPADGKLDTGVAQIGRLATWVSAHITGLQGLKCTA